MLRSAASACSGRPEFGRPIRLLFLVTVLMLPAGLVSFVADVAGWRVPPPVGTLPVLVAASAVAAAYGWTAAALPGLGKAARTFWWTLAVGAALTVAGMMTYVPQYVHTLVPAPTAATSVILLAARVIHVVAFLRIPAGPRRLGDQLRLWMDVATLAIAGVVITSYFYLPRMPGTASGEHVFGIIVFSTIQAVAILAIVKTLVSGSDTVNPATLRTFAVAFTVVTAAVLATPVTESRAGFAVEPLSRSLLYVMLTFGVLLQWRAGPTATVAPDQERYRVSVLPYVAVAVIGSLLVVELWDDTGKRLVLGVGLFAITTLVAIRQGMAFWDLGRLADQMAAQERRFRALVRNATDVIGILDAEGIPLYLSPGIEALTGLPPEAWTGTRRLPICEEDADRTRVAITETLATAGRPVALDGRLMRTDGTHRWIHATLTNRTDDPSVGGIVINLSDVTELRAYHDRLAHQASHDTLTELANRSLFNTEVRRAIERTEARGSVPGLSIALVDLDNFKNINDTFGHLVGDQVLTAVAERLRRSFRSRDLVARLGGDEFVVLLESIHHDQTERLAGRLLTTFDETLHIGGLRIDVRASIGFADYRPGDDPTSLLHRADLAMYAAKTSGKGQYVRYSDTLR